MFTRSFIVVSAMLLACAPESTELRVETPAGTLPDGYTLTGDLPADVDLHHAMEQLSPNGFAIFGTPGSEEVAVLSHREAAGDRGVASGPPVFTPSAATCTDCGDATCASTTRTVSIDLTHESGDLVELETVTSASTNFASPTPFTFTPTLGGTTTVSIPGTLPSCAAFSYYFDVEPTGGVNPVVRAPAAAGELVITEIMQNPSALADGLGEWFEVQNTTGATLELQGCIVADEGSDSDEITTSVEVAPGGFASLARSATPGFTPSAVVPGLILSNGADELLVTCGGVTIDQVNWDGGATFPDPNGASMQLVVGSNHIENDTGSNWCEGTDDYNGDFGTPGGPNNTCP